MRASRPPPNVALHDLGTPGLALSASGFNRWDALLLWWVCSGLLLLGYGGAEIAKTFSVLDPESISLDPEYLPYYLFRTCLRLFFAIVFALIFSIFVATIAVRFKWIEGWLLPLLDILQSIPILGFLSVATLTFIPVFSGHLFALECAAIFALFTSQAWNIAFSLFQSFRLRPKELLDATLLFQCSPIQRFFRLDLPYAMPGLLWNMMVSMSGGWFFVVAAEAFTVAGQSIRLTGVGSYIALALETGNSRAMVWAVFTLVLGIVIYDQFVFRPLLVWADKFRDEQTAGASQARSWLLDGLRRSSLVRHWLGPDVLGLSHALALAAQRRTVGSPLLVRRPAPWLAKLLSRLFVALLVVVSLNVVRVFIDGPLQWIEIAEVAILGLWTFLRAIALIVLVMLVWVPVGVWVGLRPRWVARLQGVIQCCAAFPANVLYPLAVWAVLHADLNPDVWLAPLMVLGTQWYVLFNVIAGASALPTDWLEAARSLQLRGLCRWRRFLLPALFPSLITGGITASGGCWNASIVAEYVNWGGTLLQAKGLGSYIAGMTAAGDVPRVALGMAVMGVWVWAVNRLLWRPLYRLAERYGPTH